MADRKIRLEARYMIRMEARLLPVIEAAAERQFTSTAEYIRRAIIDKLMAEDVELPHKQAA
jgi:hypothetical protein